LCRGFSLLKVEAGRPRRWQTVLRSSAHFTITLAQSRQPVAPGKKPVFSDLKALGLMFGEQGQKVSKVFSGF
jgi:hypothetical protein